MRNNQATIVARSSALGKLSPEEQGRLSPEERAALQDAQLDIESMNTALLDAYSHLKELLQQDSGSALRMLYAIGGVLLQVKNDRSGEIYGKGAFKKLLDCLQYPAAMAGKAVMFAAEYDASEVEGIIELKNPITGKCLTVEHLRHLLSDRFSDAVEPSVRLQECKLKRREYMNRCLQGGWTSKTLSDVIQEEYGSDGAHRGRNFAGNLSKGKLLQQLSEYYKRGNNMLTQTCVGAEADLVSRLTSDMSDVDADMITLLDTVVSRMQDHMNMLSELTRAVQAANIREKYITHVGGVTSDASIASSGSAAVQANQVASEAPIDFSVVDDTDTLNFIDNLE